MEGTGTNSHRYTKVLLSKFSKDQESGFSRSEKSQNSLALIDTRESDIKNSKLSALSNSELAGAVLSRPTIQKIADSLWRRMFVDTMKESGLCIQTIMYASFLKEPRTNLRSGAGEH